jgi:hypothetical protein
VFVLLVASELRCGSGYSTLKTPKFDFSCGFGMGRNIPAVIFSDIESILYQSYLAC